MKYERIIDKRFQITESTKKFLFAHFMHCNLVWRFLPIVHHLLSSIGYLSFVATLFTLSSISYDEFDNGNAFLFSLPITRKSYVIEKYGFGMIMGSSFWAFGTLIVILKEIIAMKYVSIDTIMAAFIILPIVFSVLAIMLPFQLKFGGEKGRIAIICTLVIVFLMGIVITKVSSIPYQFELPLPSNSHAQSSSSHSCYYWFYNSHALYLLPY